MQYFEVKVLWRNTNVSKQTQSFLHKRKTSAMEYIVFSGELKKLLYFFWERMEKLLDHSVKSPIFQNFPGSIKKKKILKKHYTILIKTW